MALSSPYSPHRLITWGYYPLALMPNGIGILLLAVAVLIPIGLFLYWAIWVAEGLYFGKEAVRWLYDAGASTYDGVKEYDDLHEATFIGNPLFSRLEEDFGATSLTLDVATGTGRLPLALLKIPFYEGTVVGVDYSRKMLHEAATKCADYAGRVTFLHHPAVPLPFADNTFDAVTCLEALEFLPDRHAALQEMVRVLRPGGWFITSNRIGTDARLLPGHTDSPEAFEARLEGLGFVEINTRPWQEIYDLIFARKAGESTPVQRNATAWLASLRCPACGKESTERTDGVCPSCGATIKKGEDGVWELQQGA
jgi:ubiquinone/menaquinone biosynthesis C-methylase UbiE